MSLRRSLKRVINIVKPNMEGADVSVFLDAFEKCTNDIPISPTNLKTTISNIMNEVAPKPDWTPPPIIETSLKPELNSSINEPVPSGSIVEPGFHMTDEEYENHVLSKLINKPIVNSAVKKAIAPIITETNGNIEEVKEPTPVIKTEVKPNNKTIIANLFKERSSLETRLLNSPLFDISLLKALNDAFNKKLEELNVN